MMKDKREEKIKNSIKKQREMGHPVDSNGLYPTDWVSGIDEERARHNYVCLRCNQTYLRDSYKGCKLCGCELDKM